MRTSIRNKLFIGITLFVLMVISLSWILNDQLLEEYYLYKKKEILKEYTYEIYGNYNEDINNIVDEISIIENRLNGNITIYSEEGQVKYKTFISQGKGRNSPWNLSLSEKGMKRLDYYNKIEFEIQTHPRIQSDFLVMGKKLSNDDILLIQIPLASIKESIDVTKDLYLYVGFISLMIGIILAFGFARWFTKPIIKLNDITKSLANLDFTKKSHITSEDEIGELAESINHMSDSLHNTITQLNSANEKLQEDIERERKIDEMRKKFISDVSHELKTPISLIQGYAEGLKDSVIEDEESKEFYCDVIIDEAGKMDKLVKDLLDLSQMESGHFKLEKENFDISILIKNILKKYQHILEKKDIELITNEFAKSIISGDPTRIEQVFTNYMNNAITHIKGEKKLKVDLIKNEKSVKVTVYNTGNQIPDSEIDNLWKSFHRVDKARARKYGGTGLGLAIVKGILNLHGGEYGVSNRENGVEFWFELKKID